MPFGLCNAPASFQWLMENVLTGLTRDTCIAYMDDILVMGSTVKEHLHNLQQVFDWRQEAGLHLKPTKYHLVKDEVVYLGYVSAEGIAMEPMKVEAVQGFPVPTDLKRLLSFQGLASYYR